MHAHTEGGREQRGIKYGRVGNARNLPAGKQHLDASTVRDTIMGVHAHKEMHKGRDTMCDCMCQCRRRLVQKHRKCCKVIKIKEI